MANNRFENSAMALAEARRVWDQSELGKSVAHLNVKNTGETHPGQTQGQAVLSSWDGRMGELIRAKRWRAIKGKMLHMIEVGKYDYLKFLCESSKNSLTLLRLLKEVEQGTM